MMRIRPYRAAADGPVQGFVGIGDFLSAATGPEERLDVLDRTVLIRRLVPDYQDDALTRVVMVDANGRLHWKNIGSWPSSGTGTTDCKWTLQGSGNQNIATAYVGNTGCPQMDKKVGIGTGYPTYKLDVLNDVSVGGAPAAIRAKSVGSSTGWSYGIKTELLPASGASLQSAAGVHIEVSGASAEGWGTLSHASATAATTNIVGGLSAAATATSGTINNAYGTRGKVVTAANSSLYDARGVFGIVEGGGLATLAYGVYGYGQRGSTGTYGGYFWGASPSSTATTYGVYGRATGLGTKFGGYFEGNVHVQGNLTVSGTFPASDAMLKTDVTGLDNALDIISQLRPSKYRFLVDQYPQLGLPEGEHLGLIAQEVQEVMPDIVQEFTQPPLYDDDGNVIAEGFQYSGVNYTELIPVLISAVQQQQGQIAELREMVSACCARGDADGSRGGATVEEFAIDPDADRKLRIVPNPFSEPPTVFYTLDRSGRMQLIANSANGKELDILQEATLEAGSYQIEWNTNGLAPGMYYVTLFMDGQPLVKKAVKVER